jgi:copper chaperone CopZ
MGQQVLRVTGMTCDHCIRAVTQELSAVPGVLHVSVHLVPGSVSEVTVDTDDSVTPRALDSAIVEAGYDIAD